jgi:GT2 family glycosyltransferase
MPRVTEHNKRGLASEVCASIVVYKNNASELSALLNCIAMSSMAMQTIIVDNSPSDELREIVDGFGAEYVWTGKNLGFGAGHNVALNKTIGTAKYHLALNPDVTFESDVIEAMYEFMENHPAVGLAMPRVLHQDGSEQHLCKLLPTPFDLFLRRFLGSAGKELFGTIWDQYQLRNHDLTITHEIPNLSGCFMFMRTSILKKMGVFDERYFMYLEDTDLCRRIGSASQTVFYPHVAIVHGYAKGSYQNKKLLMYHIQSAIKYFSKWGWFLDSERTYLNKQVKPFETEFAGRFSNLLDTHTS